MQEQDPVTYPQLEIEGQVLPLILGFDNIKRLAEKEGIDLWDGVMPTVGFNAINRIVKVIQEAVSHTAKLSNDTVYQFVINSDMKHTVEMMNEALKKVLPRATAPLTVTATKTDLLQ